MEGVALVWWWAVLTLGQTNKLLLMGVTNSVSFVKNLVNAHLSHP